MRKRIVVAAAVLLVSALWEADAKAGGGSSGGAEAYVAKCGACHGKDGRGQTTMGKKMALRDLGSDEVQKQTDPQLALITAKGKKKMPAYEKKLTAPQIAEIVSHIRTMAKK